MADIVKVVTAFTLAHSVTLGLTAGQVLVGLMWYFQRFLGA
ncbi:hypothetical protein [Paenibacillus alkalitolerans]